MFRNRARRIHFVGIGGIGMSGIAEVLHNMGFQISGSDLTKSATTQRLLAMGIQVFEEGHHADYVIHTDVVVFSSAVSADNPEIVAAKHRKIPVIPRAAILAELMRLKYGIAVAGTHGKTTTTSLIAALLAESGHDPTIVLGGRFKTHRHNSCLGTGEYLVAEADESDGSFLSLLPTIAVVTNIDPEHLDYYRGGLDEIKASFLRFIHLVPFYGVAILCLDHPVVRSLRTQVECRHITYGLSEDADLCAKDIHHHHTGLEFTVFWHGVKLGDIKVPLIGVHNVQNILASMAVGLELGIDFSEQKKFLLNFPGVKRRFEIKGEKAGVIVVDDYGHHPEEIKATLKAAHLAFGRRLVVAFQPHRYTRTQHLFQDFIHAFSFASVIAITDIYAAGEPPIPGVSGQRLAQEIASQHPGQVIYIDNMQDIPNTLAQCVLSGDMVITFGAGSIHSVAEQLLAQLS